MPLTSRGPLLNLALKRPGFPSDATSMARLVSRSALATLLLLVALAAGAAAVGYAALGPGGDSGMAAVDQGKVLAVKRTSSEFDRFTSRRSASVAQWLDRTLFRAVVYSPYYDNKTGWFGRVWDYRNLYGIGVGSRLARRHPEWILRDARGERLFLQWGCANSKCPQYAGDVSNAAFRAHWIAEARTQLARGYKGLWIDDVNLDLRVSRGSGATERPVVKGQEINDARWRTLVSAFTAQIRQAFPKTEIVHNAIWYAGGARRDADPAVRRQIRSADWVNLERGVNDPGLTGGDGEWSLNAFLAHADVAHRLGTDVIMEGGDDSPAGREYNLAAYLLIANGRDAVGAGAATPSAEWAPLAYDLGPAKGARSADAEGVLRRSFARGLVVVNPPQGPTRTVDLGGAYRTTSGRSVTQLALRPGTGAVLRTP